MNRNLLLKSFHFLIGIVLSTAILYLGIFTAAKIEHLAPILLTLLSTFFLAVFLSLTEEYKCIGYGMFIGFVLLIILAYHNFRAIQSH